MNLREEWERTSDPTGNTWSWFTCLFWLTYCTVAIGGTILLPMWWFYWR